MLCGLNSYAVGRSCYARPVSLAKVPTNQVLHITTASTARQRHPFLVDAVPLFINMEGNRLTRFGLRHIIAHRAAGAAKTSPTLLTRRVTPHTIRHTTAMHLLQSNVDLNNDTLLVGPCFHRNNPRLC